MIINPPVFVLDSFALLAYLEGEAGMERVRSVLADCLREKCRAVLSMIHLGEILSITEREYGLVKAQEALAAIEQLPLQILPASRDAVLSAAHLKASYPLSYADAFAISAAQERQATILTGDPQYRAVEGIVGVEWLPAKRQDSSHDR